MKKQQLLLCASIIALSTAGMATAQSVQITEGNQEITVNNVVQEPQLIPIEIVRNPQTGRLIARLASVDQSGTNLEINRLMIEGKATETPLGSKSKYSIVWDTASLIDLKTGEKKTTPLTIPFHSEVVAEPLIEDGDEFNAEGNPIELMLAYQRLTQEEEEEEEEEEEVEEDAAEKSGAPKEKTDDNKDSGFESPSFTEDEFKEPVVTTQSCDILVDIAQMVAIVREETFIDGVSEGGCQETLTRYPLDKKYNSCPLVPDIANMVMQQSYILSYQDPNSGEVQAQGCTIDTENNIPITETTEGCGIVHDFNNSLSTLQTQLTYEQNGVENILQACQDSTTSYAHISTQVGCSPVVASGFVTFQNKILIDVDGAQIEILPCQPDVSTTTAVLEEDCTTQRYTHNFTSNQSFLNKTYYYLDGVGDRVDVTVCQASAVVFNHEEDETVCSPSNNDTSKETTLQAQTFFNDPNNGGNQYITSCNDVAPKIPYTALNDRWQINTSTLTSLSLTGVDGNYISAINPTTYTQTFTAFGNHRLSTPKDYCWAGSPVTSPSIIGYGYCINNEILGGWNTQSGVSIDKVNSTATPSFSRSVNVLGNTQKLIYGNKCANDYRHLGSCSPSYCGEPWSIQFSCPPPQCNLTTLFARPVYLRGDNSEYVDNTISTQTKYVCGDGTNLDGQDAN